MVYDFIRGIISAGSRLLLFGLQIAACFTLTVTPVRILQETNSNIA
jgi:hypothetical protein